MAESSLLMFNVGAVFLRDIWMTSVVMEIFCGFKTAVELDDALKKGYAPAYPFLI